MASPLFGLISSGNAFKNPLTGGMSGFNSVIDVGGLTNPANPIYASLTPTLITDITTAFENVQTSMTGYQSHTDILSGVNLGGDYGISQISQIMAVAKTAEGQPTCSEFNKAFGAIMNAANTLNEIKALILLIQQLIEDPEAVIDELIARLTALSQNMQDQIASDIQAFAQAQATALANAVGEAITSLLGDNCFSNVLGAVATDQMKKQVELIKKPKIPGLS